ncbi:hypothetical protein ACS0TY_003081 [Phlomoides rotata]
MVEERSLEEILSDQDSEEECDAAEMRSRKKALLEFRNRVEEAINGDYLFVKSPKRNLENASNEHRDMTLWGVPLLPGQGHEGTDAVLMKFLKAKHYKVHEAFTLLRNTLNWRQNFRTNDNLDQDLRPHLDNVWFTSGVDKEGRPLCYNVLGNDYHNRLMNGDINYQDYLRWRVLCVEKGIQDLNFQPGGADSIIQITDTKNAAGPATKEAKLMGKKMINLLHDHYPGIVHKHLIINVPSWFLTLNAINLRLLTKRSKNKFIFVKQSRVTETLLKYATIENILCQYGGLRRENDADFSTEDKVLEMNVRASCTEYIQIPMNEVGVTVTWDVTVVGYEVTYKEEFVPDDDCSYKILIQERKMGESMRNSFYIREPGKIVITIGNVSSYTKKKAFYRYKSRPSVPMYMFINH